MKHHEILQIIANGENSSVEFKRGDIRPEQLAKEAVGMANLQGGMILIGVENDGTITGITRKNLEEWVMDTVFSRFIHPAIIPHYQEVLFESDKRIAIVSIAAGIAKPYVVRQNDREDMYVRVGSITRLATREQALRLFGAGGLLHTESLPVSGTSIKNLDLVRIDNYLRDVLNEPDMPASEPLWIDRLSGLGFMAADALGHDVCTVAGMVLFGIHPRKFLPQAGLRLLVFNDVDKQYQALLDVVLDAPMAGRWRIEPGKPWSLIDEGLIEKFVRTLEPFISLEANEVDAHLRREKKWFYPVEAIRETVLNALAHRDWTRAVDIEITRYVDRLEVISPGTLPNTMTIDKMKAGRRTPRNPVILDVLRDYGYVDARGMGVRIKVIPLTRQFTGNDPLFEATDDYLKTVIGVGNASVDAPESQTLPLKNLPNAPENVPKNPFQGQLLSLIQADPTITYDALARSTGRDRKTVRRHLNILKQSGFLRRAGSPKGGHWEVK
jgi:ATP-dependent DNA helicase RecG